MFGNDIQELGIPTINLQGFSTISGAYGPWQAPTADFSVMDDFNHIRGSHNMKVGFLAISNRKNEAVLETSRFLMGQVDFAPQGNVDSSGNALADLLLGNFRAWREAEATSIVGVRVRQFEWYFTGQLAGASEPEYRLGRPVHLFDSELFRGQ